MPSPLLWVAWRGSEWDEFPQAERGFPVAVGVVGVVGITTRVLKTLDIRGLRRRSARNERVGNEDNGQAYR